MDCYALDPCSYRDDKKHKSFITRREAEFIHHYSNPKLWKPPSLRTIQRIMGYKSVATVHEIKKRLENKHQLITEL